jgi:hypothetical protein
MKDSIDVSCVSCTYTTSGHCKVVSVTAVLVVLLLLQKTMSIVTLTKLGRSWTRPLSRSYTSCDWRNLQFRTTFLLADAIPKTDGASFNNTARSLSRPVNYIQYSFGVASCGAQVVSTRRQRGTSFVGKDHMRARTGRSGSVIYRLLHELRIRLITRNRAVRGSALREFE